MGYFVDGVWYDQRPGAAASGRFEREPTRFRNWVTPDGDAGPSGEGRFAAEAERYHLYVSLACPWAHRTVIFRKLKKLESVITMSVVAPFMGDAGWTFDLSDGSTGDALYRSTKLADIYLRADSHYSGRVTVPGFVGQAKAHDRQQ